MKTASIMLILCVLAGEVLAQAPAIPGADAGAAAAPAGGAAPAAVPEKNIWSFLGLSHENLAKCRDKFCKSGLGTLARSMTTPMKMMTGGGLLPECCPQVPSAAEIAKLSQLGAASPAEAAAAKIKADEAGAKERRVAVRYLGTVDCHYFPEAEAGIIAALRADRNECVRMEAALALANGCCCTKKTLEALNLVVSGSDKDGNPAETSERVKCIAYQALNRCMSQPMMNFMPALEPPELPPAATATPATFQIVPANFSTSPGDSILDQARRTFAERIGTTNPRQNLPTGNRSLFHCLVQARNPLQELPELPMPAPRTASSVAPVRTAPAPLTPIGQIPN